ncbi:hypothetical protein GCM10010335_68060 [Streptomyces galbus]|nr:hypothetical protein GCM10010335_68060 [Streptomyces galbus]
MPHRHLTLRQLRGLCVLNHQNARDAFVLQIRDKRSHITPGQSRFQPGTLLCVTRAPAVTEPPAVRAGHCPARTAGSSGRVGADHRIEKPSLLSSPSVRRPAPVVYGRGGGQRGCALAGGDHGVPAVAVQGVDPDERTRQMGGGLTYFRTYDAWLEIPAGGPVSGWWAYLEEWIRREVDADVLRDRRMSAIRSVSEALRPLGLSLHEAERVVHSRYETLGDQVQHTPPDPLDIPSLAARAAALPGRVAAVEALWDGAIPCTIGSCC